MRKKMRRPLRSLSLTLMALVTATATMVNATSYGGNIKIEHIWDDNNNAGNTRPGMIEQDITQKNGSTGESTGTFDKSDDGSAQGAAEGKDLAENGGKTKDDLLSEMENAGQQNGAQAKDDINNNPDKLPVPDEAGDLKNPEDVRTPDEVDQDEKLTQEQKDQYRADYENYQKDYEKYVEDFQKYAEKCGSYEEAVEKYYKEVNTSRPYGADDGFLKGIASAFTQNEAERDILVQALKDAYKRGFDAGFNGEVNPDLDPNSKTDRDHRQDQIDQITDDINKALDAAEKEKPIDDEKVKEIADSVQDLIDETALGDLWVVEKEVPISTKDSDGNTDASAAADGDPLNYGALIDPETQAVLDSSYENTQLRIKVTLVPDKTTNVTRVYVSVDGGKNWAPADEDTKKWDADNNRTYNDKIDYVEETVITFLHELKVTPEPPKAPKTPEISEPSGRPSKPKDENPPPTDEDVPDPEVPLATVEPEEEPEEEELPEEEVPQTEIPKTGDNSGLWMGSALISGLALLALLRKRDEDAEAEEA